MKVPALVVLSPDLHLLPLFLLDAEHGVGLLQLQELFFVLRLNWLVELSPVLLGALAITDELFIIGRFAFLLF